jgi:dolichyl-phosphate beta-glucosyltransferase
MPFLSIVLPAYNEEVYLDAAVATIASRMAAAGFPYEIVVVDDGSTDDTAARAKEIAARFDARGRLGDVAAWSEMHVLSYAPNRGKGHAVRTGVLASRGRFVVFMDVDLSTSPSYIPAFLTEAAAGSDVVVASRRLPGSLALPPQGPVRRIGGRAFTRLSCAALGLPPTTTDVTCGFKMFRGTAARALFARQKLDGWGFDAEILFLAHRAGLSIRELPVRWSNRSDSRVRVLRDAFRTFGELIAVRGHAASGGYGDFELPVAGPGSLEKRSDPASSGAGAAGLENPFPALEEGAEAGSGVGGRDLRDLLRRS